MEGNPTSNILKGTSSFMEPEEAVSNFGLEKGDFVADFGAGHGYFTIPMARIVGGDGKVYAIDIQKAVLEIIKARAKLEHLLNIESIWGDIETPGGSRIKNEYLDFVLVSNTLFQAEQKDELLKEAHRALRKGGRLAIIDWNELPTPLGPPLNLRLKKEAARDLALRARFKFEREFDAGSHHYGYLFKKA